MNKLVLRSYSMPNDVWLRLCGKYTPLHILGPIPSRLLLSNVKFQGQLTDNSADHYIIARHTVLNPPPPTHRLLGGVAREIYQGGETLPYSLFCSKFLDIMHNKKRNYLKNRGKEVKFSINSFRGRGPGPPPSTLTWQCYEVLIVWLFSQYFLKGYLS